MKLKQILLVVGISAASAVGSVIAYTKLTQNKAAHVGLAQNGLPANYAGYFDGKKATAADPVDLTKAANAAIPAVVHIKTKIPAKKVSNDLPRRRTMMNDIFGDFFGDFGPNIVPEQQASGSGVIISEDGYIVTNNHVISAEGTGGIADEINVTLSNRKTYKARVIGRDPNSDIAVLKIDGNNFPYLVYGDSEGVKLGQWVLAIGYPLTLDATVTAGIISATGRSININARQTKRGDTPIESFIQTDAAVNQGNSGGALVNTDGTLIGINSAILGGTTGSYVGYSFAIPVTIVKKIVADIIQFGDVQRGYLGISFLPTEGITEQELKDNGIVMNGVEGVYVNDVPADGGAYGAGIKKGDIITKVNNAQVVSGLQMSAQIASFRPGDKVPVTFVRNGKEQTVQVTLTKKLAPVAANMGTRLGAELSTLDAGRAASYGLDGGVVVNKVNAGGILANARVQKDFIITSVVAGGQEIDITNLDELTEILQNGRYNLIKLIGVYPGSGSYSYPLRLSGN